jgi:tetratricopeptide (TPR) repeat protein
VRFSKVIHLACACALIFSSTVPLRASSVDIDVRHAATSAPLLTSATPEVREETTAELETTQATSTGAKKRPNLFVRIISAPFRGLAKLFGGGKNDKAARVKTKEVKPAETQTTVAAANESRSGQANDARRNEAPPVQTQPAKVAENAARSVRAGEKTANSNSSAPHVVLTERVAVTVAPPVVAPQPRASEAEEPADYEPRKFTPFIESAPGDPLSQGRALLESGYTNEAVAELSIAAVAGPAGHDLVEANNLLGLAHDRLGQHKRAQEFYDRALSVAPQNARVLNNLGHSLYLDDRYNESLSRLKTAARLAPADTQIANNLGLVYGRLGKYEEVFKHFKRAGGEFYARTQTAALLAKAGRDRDAIKHYEAARKLNPESSLVLRQLITLYVRTGQREKAEAAERALDKTGDKSSAVS